MHFDALFWKKLCQSFLNEQWSTYVFRFVSLHACGSPENECQKAAEYGYHLAKASMAGFSLNPPNIKAGSQIF